MQSTEEKAKEYLKEFLKEEVIQLKNEKSEDVYRDINVTVLPLGKMYHPSIRIEIRALDVGEIANYSTLETDEPSHVRRKLDEILNKCVKVSLRNNKLSYKNLYVNDRLYVIYMIRELTFQNGRILTKPVTCSNNHSFDIELIRQNMEMWENGDIWQYYKSEYECFVFETTIQEEPYFLRPPNIGVQESFLNWLVEKKRKNEEVNDSFVKIMPYMVNVTEISIDEIDNLQKEWFESLKTKERGEEEFQFLNDTVDRFKNNDFRLGLKGLFKKCPMCGVEVRTVSVFPQRARDLFVFPNSFQYYLKK